MSNNIRPYRAWHIEERKMYDVLAISYDIKEIIVERPERILGYGWKGNLKSFNFDEVIPMQSTGVKDKNGIEIFEGDILSMRWKAFKNEDEETVIPGKFTVLVKEHPAFKHLSYWTIREQNEVTLKKKKEIEIIGNIYATPEILNKGKECV